VTNHTRLLRHRTLGEIYRVLGNRDEADAAFRRSLDASSPFEPRPERTASHPAEPFTFAKGMTGLGGKRSFADTRRGDRVALSRDVTRWL